MAIVIYTCTVSNDEVLPSLSYIIFYISINFAFSFSDLQSLLIKSEHTVQEYHFSTLTYEKTSP